MAFILQMLDIYNNIFYDDIHVINILIVHCDKYTHIKIYYISYMRGHAYKITKLFKKDTEFYEVY